jgi:nitronate monooxygenase/enoyl-[acyl-carrier protein] reductase II
LSSVRHRGADHSGADGHLQAELTAAVSNAGGLGGIGTLFRSFAAIKRDIDMAARLTQRPFAINHIPQALDAEAFRYTLQARPAVISFTLADPGDLIRQAHDAGARVMVEVTTVDQALQAAERGADVISAQGSESGGYCGEVSTMTLVPQVVDAVSPIPVVASGGIFDGRGISSARPDCLDHPSWPAARMSVDGRPDRGRHQGNPLGQRDHAQTRRRG